MNKSFLFLQGPHGPFFRLLGRRLMDAGHCVHRINFNGGDLFDWNGPETVSFMGKADEWPDFLAKFICENGPTDLVSFGDCRPVLESGIQVARKARMRRHIFEEGYIRPDFITLEKDGVNGKSTLPTAPGWFIEQARWLPEKNSFKPAGNSMQAMMYYVAVYYAAKFAAQPLFANFRSHRPYDEWKETQSWVLKLLRSRRVSLLSRQFQEWFLTGGRRFFMFCLQLGSDSQIHHHSSFGSMKSAIVKVLTSFSENAEEGVELLIKNHPLDPGIGNIKQFTRKIADKLGIAARVYFTEGGDLAAYLRSAEGIIVVNSTVGMLSLYMGRPTIAIGKAIYSIPGIVNSHGLSNFWSNPAPPDRELFDAFRKVLIQKTQINGSFYTKKGIQSALPAVCNRLVNGNSSSGGLELLHR